MPSPLMWGNDKKLRPLLTEEVFFLYKAMADTEVLVTEPMAMTRASAPRYGEGGPAHT